MAQLDRILTFRYVCFYILVKAQSELTVKQCFFFFYLRKATLSNTKVPIDTQM